MLGSLLNSGSGLEPVDMETRKQHQTQRTDPQHLEPVPNAQQDKHIEPSRATIIDDLHQDCRDQEIWVANSITGTPHLRPRGVRIASSRILVGMYRRRKFRVWTLPVQSKRITISFLSIARTTPTRRCVEEGPGTSATSGALKEYPPLSPGYDEALTGGKPETFLASESEGVNDLSLLFTV